MRVIVTGSREWKDWITLEDVLDELRLMYGKDLLIVHGDCPTGADAGAQKWCDKHDVKYERHPADWYPNGKFFKGAGPVRNQKMVDLGADLCIAFPLPQSRGTYHCMEAAHKAGIKVRVYGPR